MKERGIIIADADTRYLHEMAGYFGNSGYQVATARSPEEALNLVLENRGSVLLLGSNVSQSESLGNLVELLRICNQKLQIIMVSSDLTLAETRRVRSAGIFYHSLKPSDAGEIEELGQVVACAFGGPQQTAPVLAAAAAPEAISLPQVAPLIVGVVALVLGAGLATISLLAQPAQGSSNLLIWVFLGFVALIVTNQFLPIFRVKLVLESFRVWRAARSGAQRGGK